ncbi:TetR/AcrR family transcriptional regulator [Paractinoplanes atraurantiacus]|uniref:DNA-binding transcriptional regulator, AcrR family n=1 Tax=Paractinoplanes atraurantiacus TaxID=1036182 RepID=A0A285JXX5_9ACTN|nr:TetR/AcrR family transcriptional regulator [Actinoplanes atraurantiacus]SNY65128.1 DNA-binding transcriptional regulator, AcrR family [Actinoplanes atraurantiacus]
METPEPAPPKRRDASRTRQLLLDVAKKRFARDGYSATTVRDIADEAGVNVALISRYFSSKEGLFEACLSSAVSELRRDSGEIALDDVAADIARRITTSRDDESMTESMLLLLRTSGDERAEQMRRGVIQAISERLAAVCSPTAPDGLLRAQLVLATSLGIVVLRSSLRVEPLTSAGEGELTPPLTDVINALLRASS